MPGPYDDFLTAEESDVLKELEWDETLPPPDNSAEGAPPADDPAAAPAEPAAKAAPAADLPDPELAAFLDKHKGKSAEELAKIAYDQQKRSNAAAASARTAAKSVADFQARLQAAADRVEAVRVEKETKRQQFEQQLRDDPDAATKALHDRMLGDEEQLAERELFQARQEHARGIFAQAIPDADRHLPAALDFAREFNYTDDEIGAISDPRDMVMLHLASVAGRMVKAGLIDVQGNILMAPQPTEEPTDPRLTGGAPRLETLGGGGGRPAAPTTGAAEQLNSLLAMSEDELAALPPAKFDAIMRAVGG
jgi:hypothetical protein